MKRIVRIKAALCQEQNPSGRAETRADGQIEAATLPEPARSLATRARESSPLRRKCLRVRPQARRRPEPARSRALARAVTRMARPSEQPIALGRRPTLATASLQLPRMGRIDRLLVAAEVLQNPLDHGRLLDARDHPQLPPGAARQAPPAAPPSGPLEG